MPSQFYSPNAKNTGAAASVSFNSKDGSFYVNLIKQNGWEAVAKKGTFKGGESINVKFSSDEAGGFIEAVRTRGQFKFYHSFSEVQVSGEFKYYHIEDPKGNREGFGFSVKKGETVWRVGFTLGSAERFMEHLKFGLDHIFSAIYSADKKAYEDRMKNQGSTPQQKPNVPEDDPTLQDKEEEEDDF